MASLRTQTPEENSRIQQLKAPMRKLRLAHRPFVLTIPDEKGTHFKVSVGRSKSRTVTGLAWKDGSFFRANFDLPPWASDAAPPKDSQSTYVFKHGGGKSMGVEEVDDKGGTFTGVRIRIQDLPEFLSVFEKMIQELVAISRGKRSEVKADNKAEKEDEQKASQNQEAAFPIVGIPLNENVVYDDAYTEEIDYCGSGPGQYLITKTSGDSAKAVVEAFGPIPTRDSLGRELKIDSLHLREGWQPIVKVDAKNRQEALSQAAQYFSNSGFESERTYGTLHVHSRGVLSEADSNKGKKGFQRGQKPFLKARSTGNFGDGEHFVIDLHDEHGRAVPLGGAFKKKGGYEDDSTGSFYKDMKAFKDHYLKRAMNGEQGETVKTSAGMIKEGDQSSNDTDKEPRKIRVIAAEIKKLWPKPYYAAKPYLDAMFEIESVTDEVLHDSGYDIVNRFIGNASTWRGPDAKRIKDELKSLLNPKKKKHINESKADYETIDY